jgi:hypothetical protein
MSAARVKRAKNVRDTLRAGGTLTSDRVFPHDRHFQLFDASGQRLGDHWSEEQAAELVEDGIVTFHPQLPGGFDTLIARLVPEKAIP